MISTEKTRKLFARKILIILSFIILISAATEPNVVHAKDNFLNILPFENIAFGKMTYSDCIGKPNIVISGMNDPDQRYGR